MTVFFYGHKTSIKKTTFFLSLPGCFSHGLCPLNSDIYNLLFSILQAGYPDRACILREPILQHNWHRLDYSNPCKQGMNLIFGGAQLKRLVGRRGRGPHGGPNNFRLVANLMTEKKIFETTKITLTIVLFLLLYTVTPQFHLKHFGPLQFL